eukprot:95385_1
MAETKPQTCGFRQSTMLDSAKIVHEIIIPSYFQSVKEFEWIYTSTTSRYYGIASQYSRIIEHIINRPPQYNYSHVLYDENDVANVVGHIVIAPPHPTHGSLVLNKCSMLRDLYWKQGIHHGIGTMWRDYKLRRAKDIMRHALEQYCRRYWTVEIVAIKPIWQSLGYGSTMLKESHKYIKSRPLLNTLDCKVPVFTCSFTQKSVKFYLKNGYETFMIINITQTLGLYGLIYHQDPKVKKQWMSVLKDNLKYNVTFNIFEHVLPQSMTGWIKLILILPVLCSYLFLCTMLRCFGYDKK